MALDPVGPDFYPGMFAALANGGQIVSYELITGPEATLPLAPLLIKSASVHGFTIFRVYQTPGLLDALIEQGLRFAGQVRPIVAKTFPFEQAPAALSELGEARHVGKLVLEV